MARLTTAARRALPKSAFLVPSKAPGPGSYPVPDKAHTLAAAGLAGMHGHPGIEKKAVAKLHGSKGHHLRKAHEHVHAAHRQHTMDGAREHLGAAIEHLHAAGMRHHKA